MKTPQELIRICMQDFEDAKQFGIKEINWLPFKQAWFKAYDLGVNDSKNKIIEIIEVGEPKSLIQRENEPITELISTIELVEELKKRLKL